MTPPKQEQKLKPCPFCGSPGNFISGDGIVECSSRIIHGEPSKDVWQNAFCWKKIEELEAKLKQYKEEQPVVDKVFIKCAELEAKLKVAKETLENVKKHQEIVCGEMFKQSSTWVIADKALAQLNEGKGGE